MGALTALAMVFGCCSNVVFLELLIKAHPGSGNIITFSQFLFVAFEGFVNQMRFGTRTNVIPLKWYAGLVVMFMLSNVVNNYAFYFSIPLPLHMIFRSGSLIANLILGILILRKKYHFSKYVAVVLITIGICMATLASSKPPSSSPEASASNATLDDAEASTEPSPFGLSPVLERAVGILLLTFALFVSAFMGIFQEKMFSRFGRHPHEALFFSHALPLPAFALMWPNIAAHAEYYSASPPLTLGHSLVVPSMWAFLLGNIFTQLICIKGVYILASEVSSLKCTLAITLRKFISLLFSIFYFRNPFSMYHWLGTSLVFFGTFVFFFAEGPRVTEEKRTSESTGGDAVERRDGDAATRRNDDGRGDGLRHRQPQTAQ